MCIWVTSALDLYGPHQSNQIYIDHLSYRESLAMNFSASSGRGYALGLIVDLVAPPVGPKANSPRQVARLAQIGPFNTDFGSSHPS